MRPFALHSRAEGFASLMAAAVTSLSILASVVYLFAGDDATPTKPAPQLAKAASSAASTPSLAATSDPY